MRYLLAVIMAMAVVVCLPAAAQADGQVDLELGGEGATSWSIADIKPGDSGTKTVTVHNAGSRNGLVTIWLSDIISSEGTNPESETGDTAEPGELGDYLLLNLCCSRLSTNLSLPATVASFPHTASGPVYIRISPLNAGDTVTLEWQYELPAETGNEAQGDSLSFSINYLLEEFAPTPPGGGGGGGQAEAGAPGLLIIDMLEEITTAGIEPDGSLLQSCVASFLDEVSLELDLGTRVVCSGNEVPERLEARLCQQILPPPGMAIVSPVYDFTAYVYRRVSRAVTFNPAARLVISYSPQQLPDNTLSVFIACYDDQHGWTQLEPASGIAPQAGKAMAGVSHFNFTPFAVIVELAPSLSPAHFEVGNLDIKPDQVRVGQRVTISVQVANTGGLSGEYTLRLNIDGQLESSELITLAPGQSQEVSFSLTRDSPGSYRVEIGGLRGSFVVEAMPTPPVEVGCRWWLIVIILAAIAVAAWALIRLKKRKKVTGY